LLALAPEEGRAALLRALEARDPGLRCAATALVPRALDEEQALARLRPRAVDEVRAVRARAVEALLAVGTPGALLVLVERLTVEEERRLAERVLEILRTVSHRKYRRDPRPWRDWVNALPGRWRAPLPRGGAGATERAKGVEEGASQSVSFAGLPLLSSRLTFLIDLSGSMWTEREDGRTRKDVVGDELRRALEALPPATRFNVIPFTGRPRPWRDELVPATARNVRSALAFYDACADRGSGNLWDAALVALEDPEVDTLVVLSDGAPTGGRRHRLELIVPLFLERTATRRVAVDSVLVDATRRLRGFWSEWAAATGGRSISVEL
jgi:hypothetical protein